MIENIWNLLIPAVRHKFTIKCSGKTIIICFDIILMIPSKFILNQTLTSSVSVKKVEYPIVEFGLVIAL